MKSAFLLAMVTLVLSGCGWFSRATAVTTGRSDVCVGGVLYYQFPSGVTVAYSKDGSIKTCP